MKHVLTYPGFAESAHARGLYTDIRDAFSDDYTFHILPFYDEQPNGDRIVNSIEEHAKVVEEYIDGLEGEIALLAKCAGTRVAVSMDDDHIARLAKICLLNPPWRTSNTFLEYQLNNWGGTKQADGRWVVPREGSGAYVVTPGYIRSKMYDNVHHDDEISIMDRFQQIADMPNPELYFVRGTNDEMFNPIRAEKIHGCHIIDIEGGNHHLTGESRKKVLGALAVHNIL